MEREDFTIQDTIDAMDPRYRERYTELISFVVCVARLTTKEIEVVNRVYAKRIYLQMDSVAKINCFFSALRRSGLRPKHYWDYLLPPTLE